jgi:hypothetical protein
MSRKPLFHGKMPLFSALLVLPALAAAHAQSVPRLDGSNIKPASGWAAAAKSNPPQPLAAAQPSPAEATAAAAGPPTPAEMPAQPATIHFQDGLLTVHASNSSLEQILSDTAAQTGMTLEGTPAAERVFGDFGPAPVTKVLAQLLDGSESNYLVFGMNTNQAPRSLVITPRGSLAPGKVMTAAASPANSDDDDDDDDAPVVQAPLRPLIPQQAEPGRPTGIRTPQQILDEMERRRQEQQQQNQ